MQPSMMCPAHPVAPRGGEKPGCWGTQYHQEFVTALRQMADVSHWLKILFTNQCIYDCRYCINRRSNDVVRTSFTPDEVCHLTMEFYRRNYIEGLFLEFRCVKKSGLYHGSAVSDLMEIEK